jgi:hypothetical protein
LVKWTKTSRLMKGKEMTLDPVLEFERKRDTVPKYNRNTMIETIQGMQIIDKVKETRKKRHYAERYII